MINSARFRINTPAIIHETIDGETVIVNLDSRCYYSLDKTGADVWALIEKGHAARTIVEEISLRYAGEREEIEKAVLRFVDELKSEDLIAPCETESESSAWSGRKDESEEKKDCRAFEIPVLHKYTDMQDLMLLDPIHEVDETGWPDARTK